MTRCFINRKTVRIHLIHFTFLLRLFHELIQPNMLYIADAFVMFLVLADHTTVVISYNTQISYGKRQVSCFE